MKLLILLAAAATVVSAQTMVEAGMAAGVSAGAAGSMKSVGKSVSGVFSTLDKTLKTADKTASETIIVPTSTKPAAPAKKYEDIAKAEVGLPYADLIERFGPPAMQITGEDGIRKLSYGSTKVQVKDGKVLAIAPPPAPPAPVATPAPKQ